MASQPEAATVHQPVASAAGKTDVGRRRDHNEDQILVSPELSLFAVADGMGGHQAGDVASSITAAALEEFFWEEQDLGDDIEGLDGLPDGAVRLVRAVHYSNRAVYSRSGRSANQGGMGSTVVALHVDEDAGTLHIVHVGDSRCYRIRRGTIELLTDDHSMINEALRLNPNLSDEILKQLPSNVVTRALGTKENVQPDVRTEPLCQGDVYLLCSDGLCGEVIDEDILFGVMESEDLEDGCDLLVAMANEAGGRDNISALLLRIEMGPEAPTAEVEVDLDDEVDVDLDDDVDDAELDAWLAEGDAPIERDVDSVQTRPVPETRVPSEDMIEDPDSFDEESLDEESLDEEDIDVVESGPITDSRAGAFDWQAGEVLIQDDTGEEEPIPLTPPMATSDVPPPRAPFPSEEELEIYDSVDDATEEASPESLSALAPPFGNEPPRLRLPSSVPPGGDAEPLSIAAIPVMGIGEVEEEAPPTPAKRRRRCHHCGHRLLPEERFCGMCGTRTTDLEAEEVSYPTCDACGTEIIEDTRFCVECGVRL